MTGEPGYDPLMEALEAAYNAGMDANEDQYWVRDYRPVEEVLQEIKEKYFM